MASPFQHDPIAVARMSLILAALPDEQHMDTLAVLFKVWLEKGHQDFRQYCAVLASRLTPMGQPVAP